MKVKTLASENTWTSPDGKIKAYKVRLELENGDKITSETFSNKISEVGFEGEVEKYQDKRGNWKIKLPKKDGYPPRQQKDEAAIKAMWAIGQAVHMYGPEIEQIEPAAKQLFEMVDRVKSSADNQADSQQTANNITPQAVEANNIVSGRQEVVLEDIDPNEKVDLSDIPF